MTEAVYKLNLPPDEDFVRVSQGDMQGFVASVARASGLVPDKADLLAELLAGSDLRGVFSHGTRQIARYARMMRDGDLNVDPDVKVIQEGPTSVVMDGDGGLGYFPCHRGMEMAVARARAHGLGAVTTGNHHHIGSAGLYSRMALEADCIGLAASSVRYPMDPDDLVLRAAGASPLSVAVPAETQPPMVLDMGAHMLPHEPELLERFPQVFFKSLGLGAVLQVLGGVLAGIHRPEMQPPRSPWVSDQGGFVAAVAIERFMPVAEFKAAMDGYVARARRMRPYPGVDRAELPGGLERRWERDNARDGIPLGREHREELEGIADEVGVDTPFSRYESTRF